MRDVWDYVILHFTASMGGLVIGMVCGFAAGRASAGWSEGRVERVRTLGGAAIVLMAIATLLRVYIATNHQSKCNQEFRDGIAARAAAQQAFGQADLRFTEADEAWVEDQIRALDASRDPALTRAERNRITDEYRTSLVVKKESARAKKQALVALDEARNSNPVESPKTANEC